MNQFFSQHLGGLFRFSGREARKPFWLWVAFSMALYMVMSMVLMVSLMIGMKSRFDSFAAAHPEQVTQTHGPGSFSVKITGPAPELMPDFGAIFAGMGILGGFAAFLLAAAVARLLHDCGRTGLWGLLPVPFLAFGLIGMPMMSSSISAATPGNDPDTGMFFLIFFNNMIYLVMLGVLAVLCAQPGTPGDNRFGPPLT